MAIINGRRVTNIPNSGVYGADIIKEMNVRPGRRAVFQKPQGFEQIDPNKRYSKIDVLTRKGEAVRVADIPDRTKGVETSSLFIGKRSPLSRQIITEQAYDVAEKLFKDGIDFDEDDGNWFVAPRYRLPANWRGYAQYSPLLIMFPTEYPTLPPVGFYLRETIPLAPSGHFYTQAYHDAAKAPLEEGWKWYCVYVNSGSWNPAPVRAPGDWKRGDNLWTYLFLVNECLASTT